MPAWSFLFTEIFYSQIMIHYIVNIEEKYLQVMEQIEGLAISSVKYLNVLRQKILL